MKIEHLAIIVHPALTVGFVFPIIGIATYYALQTRQRRLQAAAGEKSKIPPVVGREHVAIGRWLSGGVVGAALLGMTEPIIFKNIIKKQLWATDPFQLVFLIVMFGLTVASLVLLYRARKALWRAIFATLTGTGLVVLGAQEGVWRLSAQWYWSHYYYGMAAAFLMILSLALVDDIYRDRSQRWRLLHAVLNSIALLLFVGQGFTGARDLFEIGLFTPVP